MFKDIQLTEQGKFTKKLKRGFSKIINEEKDRQEKHIRAMKPEDPRHIEWKHVTVTKNERRVLMKCS